MPDKGRPDRYRAHMLVKGPMQIAFQALYDVSSRADWDLGAPPSPTFFLTLTLPKAAPRGSSAGSTRARA